MRPRHPTPPRQAVGRNKLAQFRQNADRQPSQDIPPELRSALFRPTNSAEEVFAIKAAVAAFPRNLAGVHYRTQRDLGLKLIAMKRDCAFTGGSVLNHSFVPSFRSLMTDSLHLLTVRETASSEASATGAKLAVRIAGQSFFTGTEAFRKAAEVASLTSTLKELGLSDGDVQLLNVSTEVESGLLTKTSSATYHLLVNCKSIELLGRILGAISSQKNSRLAGVSWTYADFEKTKRELIQTAVRAAKESAHAVADSLGVRLLGVHKLSYDLAGMDTELRIPDVSGYAPRSRKAMTAALDSLDLSHATTVAITVTADFMVDTFIPNST